MRRAAIVIRHRMCGSISLSAGWRLEEREVCQELRVDKTGGDINQIKTDIYSRQYTASQPTIL